MSFYIGVDLGQVSEPTAIAIIQSDTLEYLRTEKIYEPEWITYRSVYRGKDGKETTEHPLITYALRHVERMSPGTSYPAIVERVKQILKDLPSPELVIDVTGVGTPVTDLFDRAGLSSTRVQVIAGEEVGKDGSVSKVPKRELVSTAQILLQTNRLRIAKGLRLSKLLVRELATFKMKVSLKEEMPTLWREGAADDLVLALSIALWRAEQSGGGIAWGCSVGRSMFGDDEGMSWGDHSIMI